MFQRLAGAVIAAAAVVAAVAGCGGTDDIRTVADFDESPCALFTEKAMTDIVGLPFNDMKQTPPKLESAKEDHNNDVHSCVYSFSVPVSPFPEIASMTVTVSHMESADQPLAICVAGAQTNNAGYKMREFGDQSCTSPTSDLWMRLGKHYFHVVVNPQPGFANPVDRSTALSPIILSVGSGLAERMPKE